MWLVDLAWSAAPLDALAPLGSDRLSEVEELRFTFRMEQQGQPPIVRSWAWRPATSTVTRTQDGLSLTFQAGAPRDEPQREADAQFIHDSFWLAPHMHLRWAGPELVVSDAGMAPLPTGPGLARKLLAQYGDQGGYTPGDAYELFLDEEGRLAAWIYRKAASPQPTLVARFSDYASLGPLELATERRSADGALHITFSELGLTLAPGVTSVAPLLSEQREGRALLGIVEGRCRLRGVEVPLGAARAGPPAGEPPRKATWDATFVVRRGAQVELSRYSSEALALEEPSRVQDLGLARCDLGALAPEAIAGLLQGATRQERTLLLTLGLEAWLPSRAPLLREPARRLAARCAETGDCGSLLELARRK